MEALPPELILSLSDHFEVQSLARFAQTCRSLHQTLRWTLTETAKRYALADEEEYRKRLLFPDQGPPILIENLYSLGPLPRQPLLEAIQAGRLNVVRGFLDAGIDPDFCDVRGVRWLMHAVCNKHYDIVDVLLSRGADPSLPALCSAAETPLLMAASARDKLMVRKLVQAGATTDYRSICSFVLPNCDLETLQFAIAQGEEIRHRVDQAQNLLECVMENDDPDVLAFLVDSIPEICTVATRISGHTALWHAVSLNREDIARAMISAGLNINHRSYFNETALHEACRSSGKIRMVQYLIDNGINVGVPGQDMQTELHYACKAKDESVVKLLLSQDSLAINNPITMVRGKSPLHIAATCCPLSVVRMLVEDGHADVRLKDCDGLMAIDMARQNGHYDVANYLLDKTFA